MVYPKHLRARTLACRLVAQSFSLAFCLRHGVSLSGLRLGRLQSDPQLLAEEKNQFVDHQQRRNAVEGKIGQGKRRYGLDLIREKLATTQGSAIALNVLVMNLEKFPKLL